MANQIGWAVRFNESEATFKHLDVLRENDMVLWGQWRKPGSKAKFSDNTKIAMNECEDCHIIAIGQTTAWNMHITKVLSTEEVITEGLEYLIPDYYDITQECYCWYLIDDIKDYNGKDVLNTMCSSGGSYLSMAHQIPGNAPWRVFEAPEKGNVVFIPKTIPRTVKHKTAIELEREALTPRIRYQILTRDHHRCTICGRSAVEDGVKLHVDHIIPVSKGGKTTFDNLRTLCQDCNLGKSNLTEVVGEIPIF